VRTTAGRTAAFTVKKGRCPGVIRIPGTHERTMPRG
jgi:hypothetical protein